MTATELLERYANGDRNFVGAYLRRADLREANLSGGNLSGADLSGADLSRADLSRADLLVANLREANLSGANLSGADLSRAIMPDGRKWEEYREDSLAGICDEPQIRAKAIAAWGNHMWGTCPMSMAFGITGARDILMAAWVAVYDAKFLPDP